MRILVDGDSCPVLDIIEKIAKNRDLNLIIFFDVNHKINLDYGKTVRVDQNNQAVDMEIYNNCNEGDIVVTQDYGLACLVLGKDAIVISPDGDIYSEQNIEYLLMKRHHNAKMRRATGRQQSHKKRTEADNRKFESVLMRVIAEK